MLSLNKYENILFQIVPLGKNKLFFILDKAAVRSDAAAELDRLTRAQKKGGGAPGGSSSNSIDVINNSSEC